MLAAADSYSGQVHIRSSVSKPAAKLLSIQLLLLGCVFATNGATAQQVAASEPRYEGVFSYWDVRSQSYISLPREAPEAKAKARALGLGGGKTYMRWPNPKCAKRFPATAPPKFVVRVASAQRDPHDFIQFFKLEANDKDRRLTIATAGTFGFSSRTALQDGAIEFETDVVGQSSVAIRAQHPLAPGEYVFSTTESQNSYCFAVD